jgi:hypothetical protein
MLDKGPLLKYFVLNKDESAGASMTKLFSWIFGAHSLGDQFLTDYIYFLKSESKTSARYSLLRKIVLGKEKSEIMGEHSSYEKIVSSTQKIMYNTLYSLDVPRMYMVLLDLSKEKLTEWKIRNQFMPSDYSKDVLITIDEAREIMNILFEGELGVSRHEISLISERMIHNVQKLSRQAILDHPSYLKPKSKRSEKAEHDAELVDGSILDEKNKDKGEQKRLAALTKQMKTVEDKVIWDVFAEELLDLVTQSKVVGLSK